MDCIRNETKSFINYLRNCLTWLKLVQAQNDEFAAIFNLEDYKGMLSC